MNNPQIEKWNQRYAERQEANHPAQVLIENKHLLPSQGKALELACGMGGNSLFLARQGLSVTALDFSSVAIEKLHRIAEQEQLDVTAKVMDLNNWSADTSRYDFIVVTGFYQVDLCCRIIEALAPGGLLCYQTFTRFKVREGGPSNPDFLLARGELLQQFAQLHPIVYREERDLGNLQSGLRNQAYLIAQKA